MLFLSNLITQTRSPYRVESVENNLNDQQDSSHHENLDDEMFSPEKLAMAEKQFKEKRINVTALQAIERIFITLEESWTVQHAVQYIQTEDAKIKADHYQDDDSYQPCKVCVVSDKKGIFLGILEKAELENLAISNPSKPIRSLLPEVTLCSDDSTALLQIIPPFIQKNLKAIPVLDAENKVKGLLVEDAFIKTLFKVMWQVGIFDFET